MMLSNRAPVDVLPCVAKSQLLCDKVFRADLVNLRLDRSNNFASVLGTFDNELRVGMWHHCKADGGCPVPTAIVLGGC